MEQNRTIGSKPKRILPTKPEREALNWLKTHTSHLDIGCKINGSPIHVNTNERIRQHYATLKPYDADGFPIPKRYCRSYLSHKLTTRILREHASGEQTYYFAGSEKPKHRALIMIDVDCHKTGNLQGAMAFVSWLRAHHLKDLYYEASTNGNGAHAYVVLEKDGLSVPAIKNILLKKLQPWLNEMAKGFDVELVEIKGLPPVMTWGSGEYELREYKAGVLAKIPRGIFDRFNELQETTVLSAKTLALELPAIAPLARQVAKKIGSCSGKHIDCSNMNGYRRLARELLKGEVLMTSGRHIVVEEDVAIFLLLGEWLTKHMNADGSMPWARFKGLWDACCEAGDIERAFRPSRFAAIRNQFEAWGLLDWECIHYRERQAAKWRFSDYLLGVIDEYKQQERHPLQPQASPPIKLDANPSKIIRKPTLESPFLYEIYDPVWLVEAKQELIALCA